MAPPSRQPRCAEFERLDSVGLRDAHLKASEWFASSGDIDRAVRHRLAAGDLRAHAQGDEIDATPRAARASALTGPSSLSTAELRVLHYLPSNLSLAEIGSRLFISRFTAKTHCSAIYRKLNVKSRAEAVELARRVGLLSPAEDNHSV